jgi:hypothetical protein
MAPNVKTGRRLSGSLQGHDWRRIAVGTFTWRVQDDADRDPGAPRWASPPVAVLRQEGVQRNGDRPGRGAQIRGQERTLAERLLSKLSETEFHPEKYEDEYRQRLLKAIEQKIAGQEIQRVEVETRPPTTDLVAMLQASLGRKELAKVSPGKSKLEPVSEKRPARRKRAS